MTKRSFRKKVRRATALFFKGKITRATALFEKLDKTKKRPELSALLAFQRAICENERGNYATAASLAESSAEYYAEILQNNNACEAYRLLGKILYADKRYDDAGRAFINSALYSYSVATLCEAETLCAEAYMKSETVYKTEIFTSPCDAYKEVLHRGKQVDTDLFIRSCSIAAQASYAAGMESECLEYCTLGVTFASMENFSSPQAYECAVLICRTAARLWNNELIERVAADSYAYIEKHMLSDDNCNYVSLLYAMTLAQKGKTAEAKAVIERLNIAPENTRHNLYFEYCEALISGTPLSLNCDTVPTDNIDDFSVLAEGCVSDGFYDLAAEIFKFGLTCYEECRTLVLRPYASLLYKLERFTESADCYRALTAEASEPVLYRACSLACLRAGDIDAAKQKLQIYTETSENGEEALSIAARLALDEDYPPEFCASLYTQLTAQLESHGESTEELADDYNRLGICLYRSGAPLEAETGAFKKAAAHAEACGEAVSANLHGVILSNLAECYLRSEDYDRCYEIYRKADEIFSSCDDVDVIQYSTTLKFIADLQLLRSESDEAIETLKRAAELLEPISEENPAAAQQLSLCRNTLGTVYFRLGKPELEVPELTKAIELANRYPVDNASLALLYSNRGEAYEIMGKYGLMEKDYTSALELTEENKDSHKPYEQLSRAAKWLSIGRYRDDSGKHENAISAYKSALELLSPLSENGNTDADELTAFAYYQLGNAFCNGDVKDFSSSLAAYSRSLDILKKLTPSPSRSFHLAITYDARASFYEVFGEHPLAVADHRRAEELRSSLTEPLPE